MQPFNSITPKQFKDLLEKGATIIDLRTPTETAQGKISINAQEINVYNPQALKKIQELEKSKTYLLYCKSGIRSYQAMHFMKQAGFKQVFDLEGGIMNWN